MSGIAGIVRRDGRAIPQKWRAILEKSLSLRSTQAIHTYQEEIECAPGDLHVLLMQHSEPSVSRNEYGATSATVIDGSTDASHAQAHWDGERLELSLSRVGNGITPLYTLEIGAQSKGTLFASSPMPLLQIAHQMELVPEVPVQAVQQWLLQGCISTHANLISPVREVPISERLQLDESIELPIEETRLPSANVSEDLCDLIACSGQPIFDGALLTKVWQYAGDMTTDVLPFAPTSEQLRNALRYERLHALMAQLPFKKKGIEIARIWSRAFVSSLSDCMNVKSIEHYTQHDIDLPIFQKTHDPVHEQCAAFFRDVIQGKRVECCHAAGLRAGKQMQFLTHHDATLGTLRTCSSWLANPESSLGSLAGDFFNSDNAFDGIPIDATTVSATYDKHMQGDDYSEELFPLLTLGLWHLQAQQL